MHVTKRIWTLLIHKFRKLSGMALSEYIECSLTYRLIRDPFISIDDIEDCKMKKDGFGDKNFPHPRPWMHGKLLTSYS